MMCINDFRERGEKLLPWKQSDKRSRRTHSLSEDKKNQEGPALVDQAVKSESEKFVPSDLQDYVNVHSPQ